MEEDKRIIEIHYNAFETIEEQLKAQNYKCSDLDIFETAKDDILYFEIDINGMSEENVEKDQVIMMIVRYV